MKRCIELQPATLHHGMKITQNVSVMLALGFVCLLVCNHYGIAIAIVALLVVIYEGSEFFITAR